MTSHSALTPLRSRPKQSARSQTVRVLLSALTAFAVIGSVLIPTAGAFAAEPAAVRNVKSANKTIVGPGNTFDWQIEVGCSVLSDECVNAVLTDTIPPEFILPNAADILLTPVLDPSERTITITGQTVTIAFAQNLVSPVGTKGLTNGTVTVTIPVTVRSDLDYTPTPRTVYNTSQMVAENAPMLPSTASIDIEVPLELGTKPTKSFSPATNLSVPGLGTVLTLGASNASNATVSSLTIQDPVDPSAPANMMRTALQLQSLQSATWPSGATTAVVSLWNSTLPTPAWVEAPPVNAGDPLLLPSDVTPESAGGIRVVFSSGASADIPRNASAGMVLNLKNRVGVTAGTYPNIVRSDVARDSSNATAQATANYVVTSASSNVAAGKSITPDRMSTVACCSFDLTTGTVALTGENTGSIPLTSMTISEPSTPATLDSTNSLAPAHVGGGLLFGGFTSGVTWPAGATAASITYYFVAGPSETITTTTSGLPVPVSALRVTGFSVTFTGRMMHGAVATLPFTINANTAQADPSVLYTNQVKVTGIDEYTTSVVPKYATDTVTVLADQVNLETSKSLTRSSLRAAPGQSTIATLTTHVLAYPDSTRPLSHIEMLDPSTSSGLTPWYTYFNATSIVMTPVPGDATLKIEYRDFAGSYLPLTTLLPGIANYDIDPGMRGSIYGLKLSWDTTTGFQPNQTLEANIGYSLRSTLRDSATNESLPNAAIQLTNCSASSGTSGSDPGDLATGVTTSNPCPKVTLVPYVLGPGNANILDKKFIRTANTNVQGIMSTRNSQQTRARLSWSTDGYTGVDQMVIYDGPVDSFGNPGPTADYRRGMYDAYDLVSIPKISTVDTLMKYDKVTIKFFSKTSGTLVEVPGYCTIALPCDGGVGSAHALTVPERLDFVGVEFTFTEGSLRPGFNPAPGSGVADSLGNGRNIDLVFEMRDTLRSNGWPVVDGYRYNANLAGTPQHSVIQNDAWAQAALKAGGLLTDRANDTLQIRDIPLAVAATKGWAGGDVPIPSNPATVRPTSRVTLTATNQTPSKVNSLTISEPNMSAATPAHDSPFEDWNLTRFQSFTEPAGATALTVTVNYAVGPPRILSGTNFTTMRSAIAAWNATDLVDATSFTFVFTGQIRATTGVATVVFDLGLRTLQRTSLIPVGPGTSYNSTEGSVADLRWDIASGVTDPTFSDQVRSAPNGATITLVAGDISVTTSKLFATAIETEPARASSRLTLTATPGGPERVKSLTITDDKATFWNAFDYTGTPTNVLLLPVFSPAPAGSGTVIQVEACVGASAWWTSVHVSANPDAGCVDRGGSWVGAGTWKTQGQARTAFLPTGVTAAQVEGLRLTIRRANNSQWENPQAPIVNVPILVQRRITLRTGGPVLTNMPSTPTVPGNAPSPGETVPGVTTNTVTADVRGIWDSLATASHSATYVYQQAKTAVKVQKTPAGVKAPGKTFDYTLSVTNTGTWPILNPVITDYIPSDANGAQLIFDPDKPVVTYKYALTGAAPAPATGTALPTGTSGPSVHVDSDVHGLPRAIQFTFPAGSVLEVGQVYTIKVPMMFRPGLINNTNVTNTFGISGDRPIDPSTCTAPAGFTATYKTATNECTIGTTVRPSEQAALRALMVVKAETDPIDYSADQGFIGGTNVHCTAERDTDGFSRLPCVPLTLPGQKETWRLHAQNTGTTNMPRLVLSTRLPNVSDKTILDGFVRDSQWRAGFADQIMWNLGNPDAIMRVYYTTAAVPCKLVLQNPSNENACGNDPTNGWALWTAGVLTDPTLVTSLQFVIDFPDAHPFGPADNIKIDVVTKTAALSETEGEDRMANNSLSASAITKTGTVATRVTALDYSVVSVALATGSVRLEKELTGPAASLIPDGQVFTGQLECMSVGQTTTRPFTMTLSGGTVAAVQFDNLPGGAKCKVTETTTSGQSSYTSTTVTVDPLIEPPTTLPTIELKNDYQFGGLKVSKTVDTGSATPVIPTGFAFAVSCTFLGVPISLAAADAVFTLDATQSRTISGIPINSDCVVTETDTKSADNTIVTAATDASNPGTTVAVDSTTPSATFTRISPDNISGVTNTTTFNNRFDAPAVLIITKDVVGGGAAQFGQNKTFSVDVECTFGATVQYNGTLLLNVGNAWQEVLKNVLAGSKCTFKETNLRGADAVVITPNAGDTTVGSVTVPGSTPVPSPIVSIAVTNWYLAGSVQVTKVFAGDAGAIDKFARDPIPEVGFEFTLTCTRDGVDVVIPGGKTRSVTAALPVANYTGIASGADCALNETKRSGASATRILDANGDPVTNGEFSIAVDNTVLAVADQAQPNLEVENMYRFADVSVKKAVINAPAGTIASAMAFEMTLVCTLDGRDIVAAEPAAATIRDGMTVTWTELAEGADCNVRESVTGGASKTTLSLTQADGSLGSAFEGTSTGLAPLRWTGDPAANEIRFVNSFQLAYTGAAVSWVSLSLIPLGLLVWGVLFLGFALIRRRRESGPVLNQ